MRREAAARDGLRFLGCDARQGIVLPPLPLSVARRHAESALRARPPRYGVRSGDLASAGWGVVLAADADPAWQEALEPLLRRRRRQARERFAELVAYPDEDATSFRTSLHAAHGRVDPRQIPWYLLVVGNAEQMPFGFEHDLGFAHAVGRLAFREADDLAAYAERLVASEKAPPGRRSSRRAAVFAPCHPDDLPTELCVEHFARPMIEALGTMPDGCRRAGLELDQALGDEARRARLLAMIEAGPELLVTAGHGLVYRPDNRWQRSRQGALVCADWPGQAAAPRPILASESFAASNLPEGALAGGMALMLGCFSAGTPRLDLYDSLEAESGAVAAEQAFVSAMAERLLGRHGGALAVIGHVGRAFEAGFFWRGVGQSAALQDAARALLDGRRVGEALDGLGQRHADLAIAWARPGGESKEARDPLDLWVAMHDARAWSLIGDPAARLRASPGGEP